MHLLIYIFKYADKDVNKHAKFYPYVSIYAFMYEYEYLSMCAYNVNAQIHIYVNSYINIFCK